MYAFKYIKTGQLLLLALLFTAACNKKLDTYPLDKFVNEDFWTSENNTMLALTGVYRANIQMNGAAEFSPTDWWSYHGLLGMELASDNVYDRRGDNSTYTRLSNGTLTSAISILGDYWSNSYKKIAYANFFLENVGKAPISEALMKRVVAEARFLRACQYFYMSQFWGDVPLVTTTLTPEQANVVKKASKADVVNYTLKELQEAAQDLPLFGTLKSSERGRASRQAAWAFMGRLQLAEKKFADAAATYKQIIDANQNIIDPNFEGLFNGTNENSSELIFATQYLQDYAGNGLLQHSYPVMFGGWHLFCPLGGLVEAFQFKDGTPFSYTDPRYNPSNLAANRDPRLAYTVLFNNTLFSGRPYIPHPDSTTSPDQLTTSRQATRTGYGYKKYNVENFSGNLQNSGIDVPVIRYAEILLSYLEAKLENGDAIDQSLLDATINKVRGRVSVNMPPVIITNPALLRPLLRNERRVELALEGIRYWDLLRWGIAGDVLQGDFFGAPYPGAKNLRKKSATAPADPYSRWYVTSKSFRKGQDEKWPIPQDEQNINPNLK